MINEGNYRNGKINGNGQIEIVQIQQTYFGNFIQSQMTGDFKIKDPKNRHIDAYFFKNRQLKKV